MNDPYALKHQDDTEAPAASRAMEPSPGEETPQGERRGRFGGTVLPGHVEQIITSWPDALEATARRLVGEYGPPQEFSDAQLVWYRAPDGERIVLSRDPPPSKPQP